MPERDTIALIAHDACKQDLAGFCERNMHILAGWNLIATGTTGTRIAEATGLEVHRYLSGPLGGDAQIAARVAEGAVAAVVFLLDPMSPHPHEPDIQGLQRICNVHNVPLASNLAAAELIIRIQRYSDHPERTLPR